MGARTRRGWRKVISGVNFFDTQTDLAIRDLPGG